MSDTTLNRFLAQGTNAERLAFTPDPPTPASGPDPGYVFYETDTNTLWAFDDPIWVQITSGTPSGSITASGYTMTTARVLGRTTASTGAIEELTMSGTGSVAMTTSPTFVTPALGTPSAGVLTNATGLPVATGISGLGTGVATALAVNVGSAGAPVLFNGALGTPSSGTLTNATGLPIAGITGLGANVGTFLATPSSANLLAAITDETGTGALVFANTPTLVTPVLGAATATTLVASGALTSGAAAGTTGSLVLKGTTSGTFTMSVNDAAGTWTAKWPATAGSNTNVLTTDGSGNLSWAAAGAGGVTLSDSPTWTGIHTWTPAARGSGVAPYFTINAPADTGLTAGTEAIGISLVMGTRTHASNTAITTNRDIVITGPVHAFASATGTITNGITLSVSAPTAGTNAAITNRIAIYIPDGSLAFGAIGTLGTITTGGGTGNLALTAGGTDQNITLNPSGTGIVAYGTPSTTVPTAAMGVFGSSDQTARLFMRRASADAFSGGLTFTKARNTMASPNTCSSGDVLGTLYFGGFDGTNWAENTCRMQVHTTEAWTTGAHGNEIRFYTTTTGTTTVGLALTIPQGGGLLTAAPSGGTAATWKLGVLVTAGVVPDTTRYIQLDVGGTTYKLIVST